MNELLSYLKIQISSISGKRSIWQHRLIHQSCIHHSFSNIKKCLHSGLHFKSAHGMGPLQIATSARTINRRLSSLWSSKLWYHVHISIMINSQQHYWHNSNKHLQCKRNHKGWGRYHQQPSSRLITFKSQVFPVKNANLQSSGLVGLIAKSSVFENRQFL